MNRPISRGVSQRGKEEVEEEQEQEKLHVSGTRADRNMRDETSGAAPLRKRRGIT